MNPKEIINEIKHYLETGLEFPDVLPPRKALVKALNEVKYLEVAMREHLEEIAGELDSAERALCEARRSFKYLSNQS